MLHGPCSHKQNILLYICMVYEYASSVFQVWETISKNVYKMNILKSLRVFLYICQFMTNWALVETRVFNTLCISSTVSTIALLIFFFFGCLPECVLKMLPINSPWLWEKLLQTGKTKCQRGKKKIRSQLFWQNNSICSESSVSLSLFFLFCSFSFIWKKYHLKK